MLQSLSTMNTLASRSTLRPQPEATVLSIHSPPTSPTPAPHSTIPLMPFPTPSVQACHQAMRVAVAPAPAPAPTLSTQQPSHTAFSAPPPSFFSSPQARSSSEHATSGTHY